MALGRQIVHLIGLHLLQNTNQVGGIRKITIMKDKPPVGFVGSLVKMINTICIKQRGPSLDPMNLISLIQQKLRQISAVLSGYPGYQC